MPDPKLYLLFTAITALGVLIQAGILLAIALGLRETKKKLEEVIAETQEHAFPAIREARDVLRDAAPKIKTVTDDLVETTALLRKQATRVDGAVGDILMRTHHQVARVDAMIGNTLDAVQHATSAVQHTVSRATDTLAHAVDVPTRKISGLLNGFTAAFSRLRGNGSESSGRYSGAHNPIRYRKMPPTSSDVAAAGKPVEHDRLEDELTPPAV